MKILDWARRVQALSINGLTYTENPYDVDRYTQLRELTDQVLSTELGISEKEAHKFWENEEGYTTPKIDVRGAVFKGNQILLVKEVLDKGRWTLPGGWADVGDSPAESVIREIHEEAGYEARVAKLAAIYDRNKHGHPPGIYHTYKLFFICDLVNEAPSQKTRHLHETSAVEFFPIDELPELSTARVTAKQIERMFEHHRRRELPTDFD